MSETSQHQVESREQIGKQLQKAREKLALTQQQVADRLNLKLAMIVALEENDFDALPTTTYVKGYLRSYAGIVGINADPLIELYDGNTKKMVPEILPEVKPRTQASSDDSLVKTITYLVSFSLVVLLLIWWQSRFVVNNKQPAPTETVTLDNNIEHEVFIPEKTVQQEKPILESDSPKSKIVTDLKMLMELQEEKITSDKISITLNAESWIEIYDVNNTQLYKNLAKNGEHINISGNAPFSVLVGNVAAVSIIFNDIPFDIQSYAQSGIARFELK